MLDIFKKWRKPKEETRHVMCCEDEEVKLMQEYYYGMFMEHEKEAYNRLRQSLTVNNITLYCSASAYDNFLNRVALAGKTDIFIDEMLKYMSDHPAKVYIVCKNGERITMAEMQKKEEGDSWATESKYAMIKHRRTKFVLRCPVFYLRKKLQNSKKLLTKIYIKTKKWYNKYVVGKTKQKEIENMDFENYDFAQMNNNYDMEYLPSIFAGKVDKEMLI